MKILNYFILEKKWSEIKKAININEYINENIITINKILNKFKMFYPLFKRSL